MRVAAVQQAVSTSHNLPAPTPQRRNTEIGKNQFQLPPPPQHMIIMSPDDNNPAAASSKTPPAVLQKPTKMLGPSVLPPSPATAQLVSCPSTLTVNMYLCAHVCVCTESEPHTE